MDSKGYKYVLLAFSPILLIAIVLFYFITKIDYSENIQRYKIKVNNTFNLSKHLTNLNSNNILEKFPYKIYLDSANYDNIDYLKSDLLKLDSLCSDIMLNQNVLIIALTEKLDERIKPSFKTYNPDSIISMIQWAEKFNFYADLDKTNSILYKSIYDYWMTFAVKNLDKYYKENSSTKYNFKFKYISNRCKEKKYTGAIGDNNFEKVIYSVIKKDWAYLFDRFWIGTSILYKGIIFLLVLLTLYGYICIFRFHFKK